MLQTVCRGFFSALLSTGLASGWAAQGGAAERPEPPRCALLDVSRSTIGGLVEAKLLTSNDVSWVERAEIDKVLKEQELSLLFGAGAGTDRIGVGRLLKADLLVLLESKTVEDQSHVYLVVADTAGGLRLCSENVPRSPDAEADADALVTRIQAAIAKSTEKIREIYTVPPFYSRDLTYEYGYLSATCANVVEQRLLAQPGMVVVELAEADAIAREYRLAAPGETATRPLPCYLLGEYRNRGRGADRRIELTLQIKRGEKVLGKTAETVRPDELAARLWQATRQLSEAVDDVPVAGDAAAEARELARRADAFLKLGQAREALSLYEACLLLRPDRPDVRRQAIQAAANVHVGTQLVENMETLSASLGYRQRIVEHLRVLLRVDPDLEACAELARAALDAKRISYRVLDFCELPDEVDEFYRTLAVEEQEMLLGLADRLADAGSLTDSAWAFKAAVAEMDPAGRYQEALRMITEFQGVAPPAELLKLYVYWGYAQFPNSWESRQLLRDLTASGKVNDEVAGNARQLLERLAAESKHSVESAIPSDTTRPAASGQTGDAPGSSLRVVPRAVAATWHDDDGKSGALTEMSGCLKGDGFDVLWQKSRVYWMKEKGQAKLLFDNGLGRGQISSVVYDGRYVWITADGWNIPPTVRVLDPQTGRVWQLSSDDGLPLELPAKPTMTGYVIRAAAVGPGTAILAGGFRRSWLARVDFDPQGKHRVNVFLEAREVYSHKFKSPNKTDSANAFTPKYLLSLSSGDGTGSTHQRVLVGRGGLGWSPLLVDPDQLQVTVVPDNWYYRLESDVYRGAFYYAGPDSPRSKAMSLRRCDASDLQPRPVIAEAPPGIVVMQGDTANVVGHEWWRGRLADGKLESMGVVPWQYETRWGDIPPEQRKSKGWANCTLNAIGRSHHYGLLVSCVGGQWPRTSTLAEVRFDGPDRTVQTGPFPDAPASLPNGEDLELQDVDVANYLAGTTTASLSQDRKRLAVVYASRVLVINTKDLRPVCLLRPSSKSNSIIALSPDGSRLAIVTDRYGIEVWDVAGGRQLYHIPLKQTFRQVAFLHDGKRFAVTDRTTVTLCDVETGDSMRVEQIEGFVGLLPDGALVGSSTSRPRKLIAWHPETSKRRVLWDRLSGRPVAITPDGKLLLTYEYEGFVDGEYQMIKRLRLWETVTGKERTLKTSRRAFTIGAIPINDEVTLYKAFDLDTYKDPTHWFIKASGR